MTRHALPLLAAFLGAFLATLWLVGSLYRGRRVEATCATHQRPWTDCGPDPSCRFEWYRPVSGRREAGVEPFREPYVDDEGLFV